MTTNSTLFDERYKKLNKAQKRAVDAIEGPVMIVAGPGSGKTEVLSLRVGNILRETDTRPGNILCLTFTESAALNMRDRLSKLIGAEAYKISIHTFHNLAVEIIGRYPEFFYGGALFAAADPISQIAIMEEIFEKLPHDHPLRSFHPDQGFIYLSPTLKAIGHLKKAGLNPKELSKILEHNEASGILITKLAAGVFDERLSLKNLSGLEKALAELKKESVAFLKKNAFPSDFFHSTLETFISLFEKALTSATETESTKPLSAFKEKYFKKDDDGKRVFADEINSAKMQALAGLYEMYSGEMHQRGLFDFDDMILDLISALEKHPRLRYEIQEQYQYLLVDEFQDTNGAQMRLLSLIADAEVNEGRPNLMVVGDDDQAVYKFQGAELSNIIDFKNKYRDVEMVTMAANYRSTQDILDVASHIIRRGENRLENLLPELEKNLLASHPDMTKGSIVHRQFQSSLHQYHFVSREIKRLIEEGKDPQDIAIISRKHKALEEMVPYLQGAGVPIRYEREQNVFLEPHIRQIIIIARFVATLNQKDQVEADEYLPEILSFPFWNISRQTIWEISTASLLGQTEGEKWRQKTWLEIMLDHKDHQIKTIAEFLINLGAEALHQPLEKIIDMIVGAHVVVLGESEDEDEVGEGVRDVLVERGWAGTGLETNTSRTPYASPFKDHYFSKEKFEHARTEYLSFLSSLRVFVRALREYKDGEMLTIQDLVTFVDLHEKNNISLNDESPFASGKEAVSLLTAHKAKGLEFDTVFIVSCQDEVWAGRGRGNKIPLPLNLPIEPAGDTEDDHLRLFYVALTRAKRHLYLTSYEVREDGEASSKLRFLLPPENSDELLKSAVLKKLYLDPADNTDIEIPETHEVLTASWLRYNTPPFLGEEENLLRILLENYQLSVTHLNNYLNVAKGGPQTFLEQNLLRFPQAKTPSGSYGSAIHRTVEKLSVELRRDGKLLSEEKFIGWFEEYLKRERLSLADFNFYLARGKEALTAFYKNKKDTFAETDKTEVNFKNQGVKIGEAHLTGKIDRMIDCGGGVFEVRDYKTGRAYEEWKGKDAYEKIKLHDYERQLIFYKLLVENSRDYGSCKVEKGVLEFVEPQNKHLLDLPLELSSEISKEKIGRTKALIEAVFERIMNLDFPDVSKYSQDLDGIIAFEDDLLSKNI